MVGPWVEAPRGVKSQHSAGDLEQLCWDKVRVCKGMLEAPVWGVGPF